MAIFTPFLGDLSGKIAGLIFSHNKGGKYVRSWAMPTDPNTLAQQNARQNFGMAAQSYHGLDDGEKTLWQTFANLFFNPREGVNKGQFSGMNAFVSLRHTVGLCDRFEDSQLMLMDDKGDNIVVDFQVWDYDDVAPVQGISPTISYGSGGFGPIMFSNVVITAAGTCAFRVLGPNNAHDEFFNDKLIDALGNSLGLMVYISEAKKQQTNFTKNPMKQLLCVVPPMNTVMPGLTATKYFQVRCAGQVPPENFKAFPGVGEVCSVDIYVVNLQGQVSCAQSHSVVVQQEL